MTPEYRVGIWYDNNRRFDWFKFEAKDEEEAELKAEEIRREQIQPAQIKILNEETREAN